MLSGAIPFLILASFFKKQNTVYKKEYHATHPTIVTFWEVFAKLSAEEKKKFLCTYLCVMSP